MALVGLMPRSIGGQTVTALYIGQNPNPVWQRAPAGAEEVAYGGEVVAYGGETWSYGEAAAAPFTGGFGAAAGPTDPASAPDIYKVTHTAWDDTDGSLKRAIATHTGGGHRYVVFETSGYIVLPDPAYWMLKDNITFCGETAPAPGIALRGTFKVRASNVRFRHMRFRPGDVSDDGDAITGNEADDRDPVGAIGDAGFNPYGPILFDHCEMIFGTDEAASVWEIGMADVTFRNSIMGLTFLNSFHSSGPHAMGPLFGKGCRRSDIIGCLICHCHYRNPAWGGRALADNALNGAEGALVNSVIYNPVKTGPHFNNYGGNASVVGNRMIFGPDSDLDGSVPWAFFKTQTDHADEKRLYIADNIWETDPAGYPNGPIPELDDAAKYTLLGSPEVWPSGLTAAAASTVYDRVRAVVGPRYWSRDETATKIIADLEARAGGVIDSQADFTADPSVTADAAGYPALAVNTHTLSPPTDTCQAVEDWLDALRIT